MFSPHHEEAAMTRLGSGRTPERTNEMYAFRNDDGTRRPCAIIPQTSVENLDEVIERLDAGEPRKGRARLDGETFEFDIPDTYALNSIGRKTRIEGNELFAKRLNVDLAYLARYEWGRAHQWDENELGSWTDAIGVPFDETPIDRDIVARLQPVFPKSDIAGWLSRYAIRRRWAPVPGASTLIRALLHERENAPLSQRRPANSGIAYETLDSGYGEMGVARDKRTGQTWMWPMREERDRYDVLYLLLNRSEADRIDRRMIGNAMGEELRRGGLPESFDYPCRTHEGEIVWCRWNPKLDQCLQAKWKGSNWGTGEADTAPIMMGGKRNARKVGTLARRMDADGVRWWQWTDMDDNRGESLPSFEQAMLDFVAR